MATFSQTYWPVTAAAAAAAIHIILLASNKQVGSAQGSMDLLGITNCILEVRSNYGR